MGNIKNEVFSSLSDRDLDFLVAVELLSCVCFKDFYYREDYVCFCKGHPHADGKFCYVKQYSSDMNATIEMAEELSGRYVFFLTNSSASEGEIFYGAGVSSIDRPEAILGKARRETSPSRAICIAFLRAVEAEYLMETNIL